MFIVLEFVGAIVGVVIVLVVGRIAVKVVTLYTQTAWLYGKLQAIPEPPVAWWCRFTIGHNVLKYIVQLERGEAAKQFLAWARTHGGVYQLRNVLGTPSVILTSKSSIEDVTSARNTSKYRKNQLVHRSFSTLLGKDSMLLAEGKEHGRLRRVVAPTMRHSSMVTLNRAFVRHGRALADALLSKSYKHDDIMELVHERSFMLIVDACFGDRFVPSAVMDELRENYFTVIREPPSHMLRRLSLQSIFDFVPMNWFGFREETKKTIRETVAHLVHMIGKTSGSVQSGLGGLPSMKENVNIKNDSPNLLAQLASDAEQKNLLTTDESVSLVLTFLAAGQVTTSISIAWLLYNLASHPEWQSRVRNETASWNPDAKDSLQVIDEYPLLDCVIKESLRHDPPFGVMSRETTEPVNIDGYDIPAGVVVRFPIYAIQNDPAIWGTDANEFNPNRWLREDIQKLALHLLVFWHGSRNCIGQRFAVLEMKTFVTIILQRAILGTREDDPKPIAFGGFANPVGIKIHLEPLTEKPVSGIK